MKNRILLLIVSLALSASAFAQGIIHGNGVPTSANCAFSRFYVDDSTQKLYMATTGSPCSWSDTSSIAGGLSDPGANGLVKRTSLNTTTAATAGTDYVSTGVGATFGNFAYDFSGASHTLPLKVGLTVAKPATCTQGELYFATDATAGQNVYLCTATNTWTQSSGGGASSSGSQFAIQTSSNGTGGFGNVAAPTTNGTYYPAWVVTAGAAVAPAAVLPGVAVNPQSGTSYTFLYSDRGSTVNFTNASAIAAALPQANSTGFTSNFTTQACDLGAGTLTITPATSTISYVTGSAFVSGATSIAVSTGQCAAIYSDNTNYFARLISAGGGSVTSVNGATGAVSLADLNSSGQVTATHLAAALPVAQGGTGTASPGLVAGANVTITGSWPNQTVAAAGGGSSSSRVFGYSPLANVSSGATVFAGIIGGSGTSGTEASMQQGAPLTCTLANLRVTTGSANGAANLVVTLRQNGASAALTVTIGSSAAAGVFSDTAHNVTVTTGDLLDWQLTMGVATGARINSITAECQ